MGRKENILWLEGKILDKLMVGEKVSIVSAMELAQVDLYITEKLAKDYCKCILLGGFFEFDGMYFIIKKQGVKV
jgi:hypothetical protein